MAGIKQAQQGPLQRLYAALEALVGPVQAAQLISRLFIVLFPARLQAGGGGAPMLPLMAMSYARPAGTAPLTAANLQNGQLTVYIRWAACAEASSVVHIAGICFGGQCIAALASCITRHSTIHSNISCNTCRPPSLPLPCRSDALLDNERSCFDGVRAAYNAALIQGAKGAALAAAVDRAVQGGGAAGPYWYQCALKMVAKPGGAEGEEEPDFANLDGFQPLFS